MIRVVLPYHLRNLAKSGSEVQVEAGEVATAKSVLDALEKEYPTLRGTIIDHGNGRRRPHVRFYLCKEDWSHESLDKALPDAVQTGQEPFLIVGAMAGG